MLAFSRLFLTFLFIVANASAQEVGFLDLTHNVPGRRPHEPASFSGSGGDAFVGDGATAKHREEPLRATLLSFDKAGYRIGDELIFEIEIENAGTTEQVIPWDPNIADVEPKGQPKPYEYESLDISLWFSDQQERQEPLQSISLYATSQKEGSRLKLGPGQWVRVKARVRLLLPDKRFREAVASSPKSTILAKATLSFRNVSVTVQNGGYHEDSEWRPGQLKVSSVNTKSFELLNSGNRN